MLAQQAHQTTTQTAKTQLSHSLDKQWAQRLYLHLDARRKRAAKRLLDKLYAVEHIDQARPEIDDLHKAMITLRDDVKKVGDAIANLDDNEPRAPTPDAPGRPHPRLQNTPPRDASATYEPASAPVTPPTPLEATRALPLATPPVKLLTTYQGARRSETPATTAPSIGAARRAASGLPTPRVLLLGAEPCTAPGETAKPCMPPEETAEPRTPPKETAAPVSLSLHELDRAMRIGLGDEPAEYSYPRDGVERLVGSILRQSTASGGEPAVAPLRGSLAEWERCAPPAARSAAAPPKLGRVGRASGARLSLNNAPPPNLSGLDRSLTLALKRAY